MKFSLNAFTAALCLFLLSLGRLEAMSTHVVPHPDPIRFDVFYLSDTANLNLGVLASTTGTPYLFSSEGVPNTLLPSPTLGAQSTHLSNGGVEFIIGGTSPLPGQQTPVELNDKDEVDNFTIALDISVDDPIPDFNLQFCSCNIGDASCVESSIDGGLSYQQIDGQFVTCTETEPSATRRRVEIEISVLGLQNPSSPPLETGFRIVLSPVPIPSAVWLFGSALGLLGWIRHKAT